MFYLPLSFSIIFPSSIFSYSLLHNFIIFPPQCFYSLLHNFYYFPSSMFFIPLLHLHLLIYSIYFSIHKYIDLLATLHRPHIDPTSIPHRPLQPQYKCGGCGCGGKTIEMWWRWWWWWWWWWRENNRNVVVVVVVVVVEGKQ